MTVSKDFHALMNIQLQSVSEACLHEQLLSNYHEGDGAEMAYSKAISKPMIRNGFDSNGCK